MVSALWEKFEGKTLGEEGCTKEDAMKVLFGDYKPGDKVKGGKAKKAKDPNKKKRALSGYTLFGQLNKEKFNEEMGKMDEKPKYVSYVGQKWKELSDDEKKEWGEKAKTLALESQ